MPTAEALVALCMTALVLLAAPGPSVVYAVTRTVEHGRAAGLWSVLGLETGLLIHVVAAACGIAALVASSEAATTALRFGGGAFLIALGARQLLIRPARDPLPPAGDESPDRVGAGASRGLTILAPPVSWSRARMFADGLVIDVLNPKTCLFFVAFLPRFIDPARGSVGIQTLVLGACVVVLALACDTGYTVVAGGIADRLRSPDVQNRVTIVAGWVYVGLGATALVA